MKRTTLLLVAVGFAWPVAAAPTVTVKCGANQERVWVYSNLATLDVGARLKCGTTVEVVGLEKGYVKIRTSDGNEGYVPADAVPASDLAELTAPAAPAPMVARPTPTRPVALQPVASTPAVSPAPARVPAVAAAPVTVAARVNAAPAPPAVVVVPPAASAPIAPAPAAPPVQPSKPAPANVPAPVLAPAPASSAPAAALVASAAPVSKKKVIVKIEPVSPAAYVNATPTPRPAERENATLLIEQTNSPVSAPASAPMAKVVKTAAFVPATKSRVSAMSMRDVYSEEDEDLPEAAAASAEDLSACSVFFSAYGLTPMQFKWIADDRRKRFPGVCPAPEPSMVDYVVIFTHDMDFFTTTLPDPVHTDRNGFSDWSPISAADDTLIPVSSLDKARHEYAWVFHIRRGTFDPSNFTSRRRPQFTKTESSSHASSKSIEDAMQFIADSGVIQ
jgi:hypothetical protein